MYIAVELKVIEGTARYAASACGITEDQMLGGLVRLWHRCWAYSSDSITQEQISGIFNGLNPTPGLLAFGFIEPAETGFRVCGAERYLRLKMSRKAGADKTNAQRRSRAQLSDAKPRSRALKSVRSPHAHPTLNDALSPSTEHRDIKEGPAAPNPMLEATDRLVASFSEVMGQAYQFHGGRDGTATAALLKANDIAEIDRRWRMALKHKGFPEVRNLGQLHQHWNQFVAGPRESPPFRRL